MKEAVGSDVDDPGPLEDAEYLVLERELQLADGRVLRQLPVPLHVVLGPFGAAQTSNKKEIVLISLFPTATKLFTCGFQDAGLGTVGSLLLLNLLL